MEDEKTRSHFLRMLSMMVVLSALLSSGCATTQDMPTAAGEDKKEPAEIGKAEQPAPPTMAQPAEQPAPPPSRPTPPPPAPAPTQDAISSGQTLLNTAASQDAKMIQSRLAELGLYKGAIDGNWGRRSRGALRSFKEQRGLSDPEKWDQETQIVLFRGADLSSRSVSDTSQKPISSGQTLLNTAASQDAKMIQSRLAELGLYKGAIDGNWGRRSRAALRSFKEQKGLSDPEKWDQETQVLLFRDSGK